MKKTATISLVLVVAVAASSLWFLQSTNANSVTSHSASKDSKSEIHQTDAIVRKSNPQAGKVTLSHGPVKSLNWPGMTMSFSVNDKALFDKLTVNQKVTIDFVQKGSDYVVTAVK